MRIPIAMHEQIGLRGLSEFNINKITALVASLSLYSLIGMLKDADRPDDKKQYNLDTPEGVHKLMLYAISNTGYASLPISLTEKLASLGGYSLTGDRAPGGLFTIGGPAGSVLQGITHTSHRFSQGDFSHIDRSINPIAHLTGINYLTRTLSESLKGN